MAWFSMTLTRRQRRADADPWAAVNGADPHADELSITDDLRKLEDAVHGLRRNPEPEAVPLGDGGLSAAARRLSREDATAPLRPVPASRPRTPTMPNLALPALTTVARREPGRTVTGPVPRAEQQAMHVLGRTARALRRKTLGTPLGPTPLGDEVAAAHVPAGRLPQVSERRVLTAAARLARVAYPEPGGDYSEVFAAVGRITGTGPRPAFTPVGAGPERAW